MKLKVLIFGCFISILQAMEQPPCMLLAIKEYSSDPAYAIGLHNFIDLKDRAARLCKIVPKNISHEFDVKIMRIHSEGAQESLDCESINTLVHIECAHANDILKSVLVSNSIISNSLAQETYDKARIRYQNALHHIIQAFSLKCYKTMEKLHQVLTAFTEAEQQAKQINPKRELDERTQNLYYPLEKIICKTEDKNPPVTLIPAENTRQLVRALGVQSTSFDNGMTHLKAGQALLKNLQDPTLESLGNIEITFFLAIEHFITSYYRDVDQGLEDAEVALQELKKIHDLKRNKFQKEGHRYTLAKNKLEEVKKSTVEPTKEDHSNATSEYSLERFLREDATQDDSFHKQLSKKKTPPIADPVTTHSDESKTHESEKAVKEELANSQDPTPHSPASSNTTPLSLVKSAWKNCKKGSTHLWKKLPFKHSDT